MLRTSGPSINPLIDEFVQDLLREDADYDRLEQRSTHREHLVRCVEVELRDPARTIFGISRNISRSGIGLITQERVPDNAMAILDIERLKGPNDRILASCRWCQPYGKSFLMSGWQFVALQ